MKNEISWKKGFTLIELLVVVLIIGILASVALPQYQKAVEKSRVSEALNNISTVKKQTDLYLLENGYGSAYYKDFASVDICDEYDEWGACFTKNFEYQTLECSSNRCVIVIQRTDGSNNLYGFNCQKSPQGTNDVWECSCYTFFTDIGKGICKGLESQGFTYTDDEW